MRAFADFMDPLLVRRALQQRLPDCLSGEWSIVDCRIFHPRYKTYQSPQSREKSFLSLAYHLRLEKRGNRRTESRILFAEVFLGRRSGEVYETEKHGAERERSRSILHFPDLGMVGYLFPGDPALVQLPELTDPAFLGRYFANKEWAEGTPNAPAVDSVHVEIVNYRPRLRCTNRYRIERSAQRQLIFGKSYCDDKGSEVYRRMQSLRQQAGNGCRTFFVPKPLAYDGSLRTLWSRGLAGRPLLDCLADTDPEPLLAAVACRLAGLHRVSLPGLPLLTAHAQLGEAQKKARKLQRAFPHAEASIARILRSLAGEYRSLADCNSFLLHGDFHVRQLQVLPDSRIALFDYDELALGDPLHDLTNFCVDLYNQGLDRDRVGQWVLFLLDRYQSEAGCRFPAQQINRHWRMQCLTRAYRAYIQQKPDLAAVVDRFLGLAETGIAVRGAAAANRSGGNRHAG